MIFFSHQHTDHKLAGEVERLLEGTLIDFDASEHIYLSSYAPSGTQPGDDLERDIVKRMRASKLVLVLLTPAWQDSRWIAPECAMGVALKLHVIPLVISDKPPKESPPFLTGMKRINLDNFADLLLFIEDVSAFTGLNTRRIYPDRVRQFLIREFGEQAVRDGDPVVPDALGLRVPGGVIVPISQDAEAVLATIRALTDPGGAGASLSQILELYPSNARALRLLLDELSAAGKLLIESKRVLLL